MAVDIKIPTIAESVTEGVIQRWLKQDGDFVKRDETVLELETDKVTMEIAAPAQGKLSIKVAQGTKVRVGEAVGSVDDSAAGSPPAQATAAAREGGAPTPAPTPPKGGATAVADRGHDVRATPLARKLAQEHDVDLRTIQPQSGERIREQDVLAKLKEREGATSAPPGTPGTATPAASPARTPPAGSRGVQRERLSPLRQRIAQRLVQAQHTAAMLTTFNECDMGAVMALRKQYKDEFEKQFGVGLGFMGFFVRAAVAALRAFPMVNAYIVNDAQGEPAIERHDYCDIAIAVSTPRGLVVPVLRSSESLGLADIEKAIKDMAARAKDGKITLDEMQGGTFTITNGGVFGSLMSTPILNPPQSAILGMHTIKNRPVEHPPGSGQVAVRPMMYLALSYDHRIIDGAEAVQFLVRIKQCVEDPQRLVLGM